jgi:ankyrin repeat protein
MSTQTRGYSFFPSQQQQQQPLHGSHSQTSSSSRAMAGSSAGRTPALNHYVSTYSFASSTEDDDEYYISAEETAADNYETAADDEEDEEHSPPIILLCLIMGYDWAGTLARISSHRSECFYVGQQGRTPLHIACDHDAPAVVIQALLKAYPDASIKTGTANMNPLHVTCSSQHASVHVVRVLLEGGRYEQFSMRDVDGDTPLHAACRCGAPIDVLEVLLRAHPDAVHERDYEGLTPVQRLWVRYFVILGDDVINSVNCAADLSGELLDAWNKTELLLRCAHHGTLEHTRGVFRAVHAAANVDCPRPIVKIATKVYSQQVEERDEHGRTPLMIAAAAPIYKVRDLSDEGYTLEDIIHGDSDDDNHIPRQLSNGHLPAISESYADGIKTQPSVIEILLQANLQCSAQGACLPDPSGRLPLHLALGSGKRWDEGVAALIEAYPESVSALDRASKMYPFLLAATGIPPRDGDLNTTFELIRLNPSLLEELCKKKKNNSESKEKASVASRK